MPHGLQCFDQSGNITLDLTDRIARLLAVLDTDADLSGGIWYYPLGAVAGGTVAVVASPKVPPGDSALTVPVPIIYPDRIQLNGSYVSALLYVFVY